jgi:TonB-dependent starch-binding outer membrane protein SusC
MRRKLLLPICTFLLCLCCFAAQAQTKTVTGTVFDDKGNSLPGATVRTSDSKSATQTDVNGRFSLSVPEGTKTLVISFVGMENKSISVGKGVGLTAALTSQAGNLSDVVVIGYGHKRSAPGGS